MKLLNLQFSPFSCHLISLRSKDLYQVTVLSVPPNCSESVSNRLTLFLARVISSTLKIEATRSSETSKKTAFALSYKFLEDPL
jgi:hypothetical protein